MAALFGEAACNDFYSYRYIKKKKKGQGSLQGEQYLFLIAYAYYNYRLDITGPCHGSKSIYTYWDIQNQGLSSLLPHTYLISLKSALYLFLKQTSGLGIDVLRQSSSSNIYLCENIIFGKLSVSSTCSVIHPICSSITRIPSIMHQWQYFMFMCHQVFKILY